MNLSQNVAHDAAMNTAIDYADRMINEVLVMPPAPVESEEPLMSPEQWRVFNRMTKAEKFALIYEARFTAYEAMSNPGITPENKRLMRDVGRALNEYEYALHDGRSCRIDGETKRSAIWYLMTVYEREDKAKH